MLVSTSKLRVALDNPRKTKADQAADNALAASLQEHGQLVPLLVLPGEKKGHFDVFDGGRRLKAANKIGLDQMEVRLYDGEFDADEIGTISNMTRAPMHPLDEARVVARLAADAETLDSIAQRFGRTTLWVEQRMKLESLSPKVKAHVREGSLSLGAAAALTLGTKKEQEAYIADAQHIDDWRLREEYIRRHFTNQRIDAKHALFPIADYPAECISRDLFGTTVTLTNTVLFHEMQRAAAAKVAEKLRAKGWGEVLERFSDVEDNFHTTFVLCPTKILAADRGKYVASVLYNVGSGQVDVGTGYTRRADAKKIKRGDTPSLDRVNADDVPAATCFALTQSQEQMIAALQTRGIATAIEKGDTWLALYTILAPLIATTDNPAPSWAGLSKKHVAWVGANVPFDDKIEAPALPKVAFPDREAFAAMSWDDVMGLVRIAALSAMELIYRPDAHATDQLAAAGVDWFRWDSGFLRRFRMDALQDLANRSSIEPSGPKKSDLVSAMASHAGGHFLPIDWDARRADDAARRAERVRFYQSDEESADDDMGEGDDE